MTDVYGLSSHGPLPHLEPPLGMPSPTVEWAWTSAQFALATVVLVFAISLTRRYRSPWPVMCVLGGALTAYIEPLIDVTCQVIWATHRQPASIAAFDRVAPIWTLGCYAYLMGFSGIMIWYWNQRGTITTKKVITLFVVMLVGINALEPIGIWLNLWRYTGQHGVRFFGYPMWYSTMFAAVFVMASAIAYRTKPYLHGWRVTAVVLLIPMVNLGLFCGIGWPMFLALNLDTAPAMTVTNLCNLWVLVQSLLTLYLAMALIGLVHLPALHRAGVSDRTAPVRQPLGTTR
jgi:hypothetical protein